MQEHWDSFIPPEIRPASRSIKTVALSFLMDSIGIGGSRWIRQFIYGFDVTGSISQRFVVPRNLKIHPPLDPEIFGCDRAARFSTRARASCIPHAGHLWAKAMGQVACDWLAPPLPFDADGNLLGSDFNSANVAFRFPVIQGSEIRACDDFKYGLINLRAADIAPIALPTWGHIGQIAADLSSPPREWSFMKADSKAAYKNLPLSPEQSRFCIAALRSPVDSKWYGFAPRALLFGATAAVHHYNCFPRTVAVIINRLVGLPIVNYFDDIGSMVPAPLSGDGLRLLIDVCALFGVILGDRKTDLGRRIVFFGLTGPLSGPRYGHVPLYHLIGWEEEEGSMGCFHPQSVESRPDLPQ